MNGETSLETVQKDEALNTRTVIGFIMSIALKLRDRDIPDRKAIEISQTVIAGFTDRFKGGPFQFNKGDCPAKVFLESILAETLQQQGITANKSKQISFAVIQEFFQEYAGSQVYIPVGARIDPEDKIARDKVILATYRKNPVPQTVRQLSREYNVVLRHIYRIIKGENNGHQKLKSDRNKERNEAIIAAYNVDPTPENIKRLAEKHNVSRGVMYSILWKEKKPKC